MEAINAALRALVVRRSALPGALTRRLRSRHNPVDLARPYEGETYYRVPPIKPGPYRWAIIFYFFIGGIASAAQFIATIADLFGGAGMTRRSCRAGRYLALVGALISPVLLIADLHKRERWYNMLRIYRSTSAMSVGAWALSLFGAFSGLTAAGQFLAGPRPRRLAAGRIARARTDSRRDGRRGGGALHRHADGGDHRARRTRRPFRSCRRSSPVRQRRPPRPR